MGISRKQTIETLEKLRACVRHEPCWTCDCLQGLLTELELDADEDVSDLTAPLKVPSAEMHGCLGCDPCPPGQAYADYLRGRNRGCCDGKDCN